MKELKPLALAPGWMTRCQRYAWQRCRQAPLRSLTLALAGPAIAMSISSREVAFLAAFASELAAYLIVAGPLGPRRRLLPPLVSFVVFVSGFLSLGFIAPPGVDASPAAQYLSFGGMFMLTLAVCFGLGWVGSTFFSIPITHGFAPMLYVQYPLSVAQANALSEDAITVNGLQLWVLGVGIIILSLCPPLLPFAAYFIFGLYRELFEGPLALRERAPVRGPAFPGNSTRIRDCKIAPARSVSRRNNLPPCEPGALDATRGQTNRVTAELCIDPVDRGVQVRSTSELSGIHEQRMLTECCRREFGKHHASFLILEPGAIDSFQGEVRRGRQRECIVARNGQFHRVHR